MSTIDRTVPSVMPVAMNARQSVNLRFVDEARPITRERDWRKAPPVVHLARTISVAATILWSLAGVLILRSMVALHSAHRPVTLPYLVSLALSVLFLGVNVWLIGALKRGQPGAWLVQRALALACLPFVPIGTLPYLLVLKRWSLGETSAWFTRS